MRSRIFVLLFALASCSRVAPHPTGASGARDATVSLAPANANPRPEVVVDVDGSPASAVANAIGAVAAAQRTGGTPCEQAFNGMVAILRGLHTADAGARQPPDRARFIAACTELPVSVQQCMVFTYAIAHQAECHDARGHMTPDQMARMRAVMTSH